MIVRMITEAQRTQWSTLSGRVAWLAGVFGNNARQLSIDCGLTHSTLGHFISGKNKGMRPETAEKINIRTGVSVEWLLFGKGEPGIVLVRAGEPDDRIQSRIRTRNVRRSDSSHPRIRAAKKHDK